MLVHIFVFSLIEYIGEVQHGEVQNGTLYLTPHIFGMGLLEGCTDAKIPLADPKLRADMEVDIKAVADGRSHPDVVLKKLIERYRRIFELMADNMDTVVHALENRLKHTSIFITYQHFSLCIFSLTIHYICDTNDIYYTR